MSKADAVCFGTLGLCAPRNRTTPSSNCSSTPRTGALKFFDINLRANFYSKELIEELLGYANIFKINDDELIMMREMFSIPEGNDEEACKWFMDRFDLEYTILTGGATFSTITAKDGEASTLLTPHVEVADTVGAGDSFSGSFTGKLLCGALAEGGSASRGREHRRLRVHQGRRLAWPTLTEGVPPGLPRRSRPSKRSFSFHHHRFRMPSITACGIFLPVLRSFVGMMNRR